MKARVHFVGICGKAMGAIAIALAEAGHQVTGSDEGAYPPMSDLLAAAGIRIATPFSSANLPPDVDVVVTGRRLAGDNEEARAARDRGLHPVSFPELLRDWFLQRTRNLVVSGGVGKTTTAAMLAWILETDGYRPDFLIGGVHTGLGRSARLGAGDWCVIEGDEYATAADDTTPKFLHYRPEVLAVTNTLDDHPDIYPDRASLVQAFESAVRLLPAHGCLIVHANDPATPHLAAIAPSRVIIVGEDAAAGERITELSFTPTETRFHVRGVPFTLRLAGRMNVRNAALAALAAEHAGVSLERAAHALASFDEVSNRQERVDAGPMTVVTDKATHPAAIAELHDALRQRFPGRPLLAVIRPRATGGRTWIYQRDLPAALSTFDRVLIATPYEHRPPAVTRWQHTPFSVDLLMEQLLARGCDVREAQGSHLAQAAQDFARDQDVVILLLPESHVADATAVTEALARSQRLAARS